MSDLVLLRGLRVMAYCGVLDEEQQRKQPFEIDLDVSADLVEAGASDDLNHTVNYGALGDQIQAHIDNGRWALLEKLATEIADVVLADPRATAVTVELRKLRPPMAQDVACSGVRITRSS